MADIQELFITLDGLIQEVRAGMSDYESECLQEKLICANMKILISTAKYRPELKAFYNGNGQRQQRTEQEEESGHS